MVSEMPWQVDTPQVNGRKEEKAMARKRGARLHAMSGAGSEKNDFSNEDTVYEAKNVAKTHTIKGEDLLKLFIGASQQGKDAIYLVRFEGVGITLEGRVTR